MTERKPELVLASGSPRRRELLERFGYPFKIIPARGEERPPEGLTPGETVIALAEQTAREVAALCTGTAVVVGADTVVERDGVLLGKPRTFGFLQDDTAHTVLVDMDDLVFRMRFKERTERFFIPGTKRVQRRQVIDRPAELLDFFAVVAVIVTVRQKIELHGSSVDPAVIIHQHGFEPAAVHVGDDLQYSDHDRLTSAV